MSKKYIGVCLIGAGRAGMIHGFNFKSFVPNARLVAVVDPNEECARNACKELEIDRFYLNYIDALADNDVDAVVIP